MRGSLRDEQGDSVSGTELFYACSAPHHPPAERGIRWDDPTLDIGWPAMDVDPILSDRDLAWPYLTDAPVQDFPRYHA